jgi:hypothetical protein
MEAVLRALAARQPVGVAVTMQPEVQSVSELTVDVAYKHKGWLVLKHYHVSILEDRVSIILEKFQIKRTG